jgi:hypothetical protein
VLIVAIELLEVAMDRQVSRAFRCGAMHRRLKTLFWVRLRALEKFSLLDGGPLHHFQNGNEVAFFMDRLVSAIRPAAVRPHDGVPQFTALLPNDFRLKAIEVSFDPVRHHRSIPQSSLPLFIGRTLWHAVQIRRVY